MVVRFSKSLLQCSRKRRILYQFRRDRSTIAWDPVSEEALSNAWPFEKIPGPKPLPIIANMHRYMPVIGEYSTKKWHESVRQKFEEYGPIVREEIVPGSYIVYLYDPKDMEAVHRHEGKYPRRVFFETMKMIRESNPDIYSSVGLAPGNGEEWLELRRRSQKPMMRPQVMKTYLPQINVISEDVVRRIRMLRQSDHQVPDLMNELFKWALESVTYILFNQRMGCLAENPAPDSMGQLYIQSMNDFFKLTSKVELSLLPFWRFFPSLSPSFRKLKKVHDFFFKNAMQYVKSNIQTIDKDEETEEIPLMQLLLETCSPGDASVMAVDLMAAGIDTTSLSTAYVLLNLAANPRAQKKLQDEVDRVLPDGKPLTVQAIDEMPYLRACIKESMRVTPIVQGTSRTLDKDIVLSGYRVPANTQFLLNYYVSCLQEKYFPDASKFKPERWIRSKDGGTLHSFAYQPFGFGPRMCIGRRIAELEMLTFVAKIMQNFWLENHSNELDINFQLVLMIKSPLRFEFHERRR